MSQSLSATSTRGFGTVQFSVTSLVPEGRIALLRGGQVVWVGPIASPIEDAEFDSVIINPRDADRLKDSVMKFNRRADIIRALLENRS